MNRYSRVKSATSSDHSSATNGLRKNLSVSKPSIGASLKAPPKADSQPPMLPTSNTAARGARPSASRCSAVSPQAIARLKATRPAAADQRSLRLATTRPITWSCMGMKYFDWSSSRR